MGRRNYRFFYAFILSLSFLTAFIFACVVTHLTLRELGQHREAGGVVASEPGQVRVWGHHPSELCPLLSLPLQALREAPSSLL